MIPWSAPDPHLELIHVSSVGNSLLITVKSNRSSARCPQCHARCNNVHSRYTRSVQDLPISDQTVYLIIIANKWFCTHANCSIKIFAERFEGISTNGKRTNRTIDVLRKMAFSSSCLAAEKVALAAHIPVSHDTLLSIIKRTNISPKVSPFLGLDYFAFKKGHTYGTLICDLRSHEPLAILPDRQPATITNWLKAHPFVQVVSRDGFSGFRQGITMADSSITQVYDRFHFIRNAKRQLDSYVASILPPKISWS
ncbi:MULTISPECIES: transposase [unclassified Sporosarcina]|uniref:transposase n=1 Tax=unclassified Sporosarcina TaxID=2647733 RepID=UPI001D5D10F5|nr:MULTISPECIES: transposase [unclassified Sporosarcina]MBO0588354.1 transposase [Sporosarcina sp. E16_8]MBO0603625.1 transposase [Sporosarcina sp. E16_3]